MIIHADWSMAPAFGHACATFDPGAVWLIQTTDGSAASVHHGRHNEALLIIRPSPKRAKSDADLTFEEYISRVPYANGTSTYVPGGTEVSHFDVTALVQITGRCGNQCSTMTVFHHQWPSTTHPRE